MTPRKHPQKDRKPFIKPTPETDEILRREFATCESIPALAQQLGWSKHSVYQRARTLKLKRPRVDRSKQGLAANEAKQQSMDSTRIVASALQAMPDLQRAWL